MGLSGMCCRLSGFSERQVLWVDMKMFVFSKELIILLLYLMSHCLFFSIWMLRYSTLMLSTKSLAGILRLPGYSVTEMIACQVMWMTASEIVPALGELFLVFQSLRCVFHSCQNIRPKAYHARVRSLQLLLRFQNCFLEPTSTPCNLPLCQPMW